MKSENLLLIVGLKTVYPVFLIRFCCHRFIVKKENALFTQSIIRSPGRNSCFLKIFSWVLYSVDFRYQIWIL